MPKSRDEEIETRAVEFARADHLEWVKRPHRSDQPDTPDGATNAERNDYRQQAREQIDSEERHLTPTPDRPSPAYQLRLFGPDGKVGSSISLMVEDEAAALAQARELARSQPVELWDRNRLILRLPER